MSRVAFMRQFLVTSFAVTTAGVTYATTSSLGAHASEATSAGGTLTTVTLWWLSLVPAASALFGALLGALAPIVERRMSIKAEARRERAELAVTLGIRDFEVTTVAAQFGLNH